MTELTRDSTRSCRGGLALDAGEVVEEEGEQGSCAQAFADHLQSRASGGASRSQLPSGSAFRTAATADAPAAVEGRAAADAEAAAPVVPPRLAPPRAAGPRHLQGRRSARRSARCCCVRGARRKRSGTDLWGVAQPCAVTAFLLTLVLWSFSMRRRGFRSWWGIPAAAGDGLPLPPPLLLHPHFHLTSISPPSHLLQSHPLQRAYNNSDNMLHIGSLRVLPASVLRCLFCHCAATPPVRPPAQHAPRPTPAQPAARLTSLITPVDAQVPSRRRLPSARVRRSAAGPHAKARFPPQLPDGVHDVKEMRSRVARTIPGRWYPGERG